MKKCPKCNADNKDTQMFCSYCGASLNSPVNKATYAVVMRRPASIQWVMNVIHIKVDNVEKYELANDSTITVQMTPGRHDIEMSVFGMPRKKKFALQVNEDLSLICSFTVAGAVSYLALPVKVVDSFGRKY